jgi:hypothetical protein
VTRIRNKIESAGVRVIIRAVGARVVEMEESGSIVHAAGGKAVRMHEATGSA